MAVESRPIFSEPVLSPAAKVFQGLRNLIFGGARAQIGDTENRRSAL